MYAQKLYILLQKQEVFHRCSIEYAERWGANTDERSGHCKVRNFSYAFRKAFLTAFGY